jgi:hypothetical protein
MLTTFLTGWFCLSHVVAQNDTLNHVPGFLQDQIETYLENLDTDSEFDFNELGELLAYYLQHPLAINEADFEDLQVLGILTDLQIADFLNYRENLGTLESIYELQSVPSFDQKTIAKLRPFVTIRESSNINSKSLVRMLLKGQNELFIRGTRVIETQAGYESRSNTQRKYLGSPNQYYVRFKHQFEQKLSYGFTLEKDPGEPFFNGINQNGFDYLSFHLFLKDVNQKIRAIALGDYAVSMGQGLIMHSGYGGGKSSFVTNIKRGGRSLRPYTSVNEASFLRGAAASFQFKPINITVFASQTKRDANLISDTLDRNESTLIFSSLQTSGLHRTESEIADKHAITHHLAGTSVNYKSRRLKLGFNALYNHFTGDFRRSTRPYNIFNFRGSSLANASLDYSYLYRNVNVFGETAISDNGAKATLNGLLISLSRYLDLAVLQRHISARYQALQAAPLIESSTATNEKGLYIGAEIKFSPSFWISLYSDYWKHPWLRFTTDAPSTGKEQFVRFTYYQKRRMEGYIQYRFENKALNKRNFDNSANQLFYGDRQNFRLHLNHQIHRNLELRNRVEFIFVNTSQSTKSRGFMMYQDVIFKSIKMPLSFTGRISYFDTDDYSSRIYAYENDILYSFSIPPYYDRGIRYYLNFRYRFRSLTWELRAEQTRLLDLNTISSGNDQIDGNTKTRIKLQVRFQF